MALFKMVKLDVDWVLLIKVVIIQKIN
jgi:hypothetical protein